MGQVEASKKSYFLLITIVTKEHSILVKNQKNPSIVIMHLKHKGPSYQWDQPLGLI
jgi:hypothetical protein